MALIQPSLDEIERFPAPLEHGEREVLDWLTALDDEWTVWAQPWVAMAQPDFVCAHDVHGVVAIEVKDWAPDLYRLRSDGSLEVRTDGRWQRLRKNPVDRAAEYRGIIFEYHFSLPASTTQDFPMVRGLVILTLHEPNAARLLLPTERRLDNKYVTVWGNDLFQTAPADVMGTVRRLVPVECMSKLRMSLAEPEFIADQRLPLSLSKAASNLARNPSNAKLRRARGPAGCGKSLGLAARAASLAADGKSVLVVSFNITLSHYLRDLTSCYLRQLQVASPSGAIRRVRFIHFHGFCRDVVRSNGQSKSNTQGHDTGGFDDSALVRGARAVLESAEGAIYRFDAILVDEGQDFDEDWWRTLRCALAIDGEMLIVVDKTQDLYGRASWLNDERMRPLGFRDWTELAGSYRMPVDLIPIVAEFASRYLTAFEQLPPIVPPDHDGFAAAPTIRRWRAVAPSDSLIDSVVGNVVELLTTPGLVSDDIVILADHAVGRAAADILQSRGVTMQHVFTEDDGHERNHRKHSFWGGTPGVKGSTVNSFKGWEARAVVIAIDDEFDAAIDLYVALTRCKGDPQNRSAFVSVVCRSPTLNEFAGPFVREVTLLEAPGLAGQIEIDFLDERDRNPPGAECGRCDHAWNDHQLLRHAGEAKRYSAVCRVRGCVCATAWEPGDPVPTN